MKFLAMAICFLGLSAHADVDYVAIGKIVNDGKAKIADTRAGVVCILKKYEADQSCANLETSNDQLKKVLAKTYSSALLSDCDPTSFKLLEADSPYYIADQTVGKAQELSRDAKPDDAILAVIEKYQRSLDALQAELEETYAKVKFNETYVSKCMFGLEPSPVTIKTLICQ